MKCLVKNLTIPPKTSEVKGIQKERHNTLLKFEEVSFKSYQSHPTHVQVITRSQ